MAGHFVSIYQLNAVSEFFSLILLDLFFTLCQHSVTLLKCSPPLGPSWPSLMETCCPRSAPTLRSACSRECIYGNVFPSSPILPLLQSNVIKIDRYDFILSFINAVFSCITSKEHHLGSWISLFVRLSPSSLSLMSSQPPSLSSPPHWCTLPPVRSAGLCGHAVVVLLLRIKNKNWLNWNRKPLGVERIR